MNGEEKFRISVCGEGDIPALLELMSRVYEEMEHKEWYAADGEEFLKAHVSREGFLLKAADESSGALAGFLAVRIPGEAEDNLGRCLGYDRSLLARTAHMESAAVDARFRGWGLQGRLMEEAEAILAKRGFCRLLGTVHPDNRYSRNHFLRLGYHPVLRSEKYGGLMRDIMEKRLDGIFL